MRDRRRVITFEYRQLLLVLAGAVVGLVVLRQSNMLRYIPNNRLGIA